MEAKRPIHLHGGSANNATLVLGNDILRVRAAKEVEVETSAECAIQHSVFAEKPFLTMGWKPVID